MKGWLSHPMAGLGVAENRSQKPWGWPSFFFFFNFCNLLFNIFKKKVHISLSNYHSIVNVSPNY